MEKTTGNIIMAKYDNTKFYWLMLKENFFEEDTIQWLEEQPNGKDYSLFYLKLCLKALKTNGVLIRKVGSLLIPYDTKKIAELTRTDFDTVVVAMELLKKIGLVEILDNGEIYIKQLQDMIGSKSIGAFKKQLQRQLKYEGQQEDKCPPEKEEEKEEEKEKEKEEDIIPNKNNNIYSYLEDNFGRTISPLEYEKIDSWLNDFDIEIVKYAIKTAVFSNIKNFRYLEGILRNWKSSGFKTLQEIKDAELSTVPATKEYKEIDIFDYNWLEDDDVY